MDREDIRLEIRRLVKDTDTTNPRWSDAVLNERIDKSHEYICATSKCYPERYTVSTVANTAEYTMPSYYVHANTVMYYDGSDWIPLQKRTEQELDIEFPNWRSDTGTPSYWYQRINSIGLVPYPTTSTTNGLRVDMARIPTAFTMDTGIPYGGVTDLYPYHLAICYHVAQSCSMDDGVAEKYAIFKKEFDVFMKRLQSQMNNKNTQTRMPNVYDSARTNNRRA